jgi:hypothetical protein
MSIDDFKKKAKLSMDEMYDNQGVGKPASQHAEQQIYKSADQEKDGRRDGSNEGKNDRKIVMTDYRSLNKSTKDKRQPFTKKMTFWMTEEVYDAFNEIYVKRLAAKKK